MFLRRFLLFSDRGHRTRRACDFRGIRIATRLRFTESGEGGNSSDLYSWHHLRLCSNMSSFAFDGKAANRLESGLHLGRWFQDAFGIGSIGARRVI